MQLMNMELNSGSFNKKKIKQNHQNKYENITSKMLMVNKLVGFFPPKTTLSAYNV